MAGAVAFSREAAEALEAVEAAAPFAEKLAANATAEVLQYLELLCKKIALSANDLETHQLVAAMRAMAAWVPGSPVSGGPGVVRCTPLGYSSAAAGLDRQLSASGLARLLAAAGRLGLQAEQTAHILHRIVTVSSPIRPMPAETLASLCLGLTLQRWMPSDQSDFWQVASWLATLDQAAVRPTHGFSMRNFALGLLIKPEGRAAIDGLRPDLQKAMARLIRGTSTHRRPVSDTTLKFRHEAAEVLRRAGRPYDLDVSLGLGFVDLALPGPDGVFWLLDGPEAFRRPFRTDSTRPKLELVPMETFRSELFMAVLNKAAVEAMDASLDRWEGEAPRNGRKVLGIPQDLAQSKRFPWLETNEVRLARLDWLEWERMPSQARLAGTPLHTTCIPRIRIAGIISCVKASIISMARKTLGERAGVFLTVVLLLVIGIHVCLLESENFRFRHPGRALKAIQVAQVAPESGYEAGNVEDRVSHDQPMKDSPEKTGRSSLSTSPETASPWVEAEEKDDGFAHHSAEESIKEDPQNASTLDLKVEAERDLVKEHFASNPAEAPISEEGQWPSRQVVSDDHHVEKEPKDVDEQVLLEMNPALEPPDECHCPSVLNGWHKPADPKCLQNCSSSFFQHSGRPVVGIQNGPLVFPAQHDEF
eukprot:s3616_g7.t1